MKILTNKEKDLLQDMLNIYLASIDKKVDAVSEFIGLAHVTGDIASAGEKYVENRKFFDVKDNIKQHLKEQKITANNLIHSIINNGTNN